MNGAHDPGPGATLGELHARAEELDTSIARHLGRPRREPLTFGVAVEPAALGGVRRRVGAHCAGWVPVRTAEAATLCVSELLANVLAHVGEGAQATVEVARRGPYVRVAVTDPDPYGRPVRGEADPDAECGRGLALVAALAVRWGVTPDAGGGKTVWCELDATARADT